MEHGRKERYEREGVSASAVSRSLRGPFKSEMSQLIIPASFKWPDFSPAVVGFVPISLSLFGSARSFGFPITATTRVKAAITPMNLILP